MSGSRPAAASNRSNAGRMSPQRPPSDWIAPPAPFAGRVNLVDSDPTWPAQYEAVAARIRAAIGDTAVVLEHAGSTSVPGLAAKNQIDVVLGVPDSTDEAAYVPPLEVAGFEFALREPEWFEHRLFRGTEVEDVAPNVLVLHIQPDEGIALTFQAKVPGPVVKTGNVEMDFNYSERFGRTPSTGYETLLYDCMNGDPTLFQRADSALDGWAVVMPILDVWKALPPRNFPNYEAGSWGPKEANELLARDGRAWWLAHPPDRSSP